MLVDLPARQKIIVMVGVLTATAARAWHLAENGATKGPFGDADLAGMAASGALGRATQVWTAGQDGWKAAGDTELARLFAMVPPPPPPPGA